MSGTSRATRSYVVVPAAADFGGDATALEGITLYGSDGTLVPATTQMPHQADTTAADLTAMKADFNTLLAKLQTAGLMASS